MPYGSGHAVSYRLVDRRRYQAIVCSLPHVDSPFDCCYVESPAPIEELAIADQPFRPLGKALSRRIAERGLNLWLKQDLAVVVVDRLPHLVDVGPAKPLGRYAKCRVHEAKS